MSDENQEKEQRLNELYKLKADAFDLRVTLDRLTGQGNQLATVYNQICAKIQETETIINQETKGNVDNNSLPK